MDAVEMERRSPVASVATPAKDEDDAVSAIHASEQDLMEQNEEEEEAECRVCRGEAEPDRRLFAPCKCSGSIRYTHADCLEQWLEHSGKKFCELCSHEFEFKPLYDANAPDVLPWSELVSTVLRMACFKWLPFLLRGMLVLVLWLAAAPWCTSWLYRMWLLRASAMVNVNFSERFDVPHIVTDIFSGIILIVCIVFSFLALMSFADFLRFHLDENEEVLEDPHHHHAHGFNAAGGIRREQGANGNARIFNGVDDGESDDSDDEDDRWIEGPHQNPFHEAFRQRPLGNELADDAPAGRAGLRHRRPQNALVPGNNNNNNNNGMNRGNNGVGRNNNNNRPNRPNAAPNNNNNNNNRDWDDDFDHMEINIAMEDLLGLRGEIGVLFRNVSWFLAFNGAYLGLFAFIPYTLGSTILSAFAKILGALPLTQVASQLQSTTLAEGEEPSVASFFVQMLSQSVETARVNGDCLQLVDLCTCAMGYFSICFTIVLWRFMVTTASLYIHRPVMDGLLWALRCLTAIVKVSTLLLLKMVILPIVLGFGIDFATLHLFMVSFQDRIAFCMQHMVGALLVHWVLGITFMLFVTVSVLQLREVVHPDILAKAIRPQEAHPDLLKTLLSENCVKHARRMVLSLAIYAALLVVLIHVPVRVAEIVMPSWFPLTLRFQHYSPEVQVPLELLVVHLVVLGILEHAKNEIGRFQHLGLTYVCEWLGLSEYLMPRVDTNWPGARSKVVVLPPPPLHFHPQAVLPPEQLRVNGHRYLPWPEEGLDDLNHPMEYELLPRKTPSHLVIRLMVLGVCTWAACVLAIASAVLGTLYLGRVCTAPFERVTGILHEPIAMAAGVQIVWYMANGLNALCILTRPDDQIERTLVERGYCVKHLEMHRAIICVVGWAFVCPLLVGCFATSCFPTADASWSETLWLGYLLFNLFAWFVCCFRTKSNRRRRRNRRQQQAAIAAQQAEANGEILDLPDHDHEDDEDDDDEEEEEEEEQAAAVANANEALAESDSFLACFRKCYQQLLFNVTVHDDDDVRLARDNIADKCFDVRVFQQRVLTPMVLVLVGMIVGPSIMALVLSWCTAWSSAQLFVWSAIVLGTLSLLLTSQAQVQTWVATMKESIRNERYLIGRQLQDLAR